MLRTLRNRQKAFAKYDLPVGEFKKLEKQIRKNTSLEYNKPIPKNATDKDVKEAMKIYKRWLGRKTTTARGYLAAERKRIATWELDLNAEIKRDRKVMRQVGKLVDSVKSKLQAYGYDSHMLKEAVTNAYNDKGTLQSVSKNRLSKLLTNYINAEGENLIKDDVDDLITKGYIIEDGKKYTYNENGKVEYVE